MLRKSVAPLLTRTFVLLAVIFMIVAVVFVSWPRKAQVVQIPATQISGTPSVVAQAIKSGTPQSQQSSELKFMTIEQKMQLSDAQWKQLLTPLQYSVLRQAGTETPFTGDLLHNTQKGTYVTADCGEAVFHSEQKYDSETGWPSFWAPIAGDAVVLRQDNSGGMQRIEVLSPRCHSHLGHVFGDGPAPTGRRYCINSAALVFIPDETK